MYKINFYPEYFEKRAAARRQMFGMALASLLLGLVAILVVSMGVSVFLLHERAQSLRDSLPRLSASIMAESETPPEVKAARELLKIRNARIDWSPKLGALPERIDASLKLTRVEGKNPSKGSPAVYELTGEALRQDTPLEDVSRFIQELEGDPRITGDLPRVRLGTLKEGQASEFVLVCESRGGGS